MEDEGDWIAQHFFAGGVMPRHNPLRQFPDIFTGEEDWRWSGTHYAKTALDWLANYDAATSQAIRPVLKGGLRRPGDALAQALAALLPRHGRSLPGHRGGEEWGVSHYRLKPS